MSKIASANFVLMASRLSDGVVVFLDFEGAWNENILEAVVAHSPDEARALEDRGAYDASRNLVAEPYLTEVSKAEGAHFLAGEPTIPGLSPRRSLMAKRR